MTLGTVIEARLRAEFAPLELTVRDDSADHAGMPAPARAVTFT